MEELFNFRGKIRRLEYLQISILCYLILITFAKIISIIFKPEIPGVTFVIFVFALILIGISIAIKLAAMTKRIRDINWHPIFICIAFIPIINILFSFFLLCINGKDFYENKQINTEENTEVKTCIYCCAKIPFQARKCMYCGEWVDFESFEEEMNKPHSYWTINIILAVLITGLCFLPEQTPITKIFSKDIFKTKNLTNYYDEAKKFCSKFDFHTEPQKYHCYYSYIEENADSKINKELLRINHNCRSLSNEESEYMDCVVKTIVK